VLQWDRDGAANGSSWETLIRSRTPPRATSPRPTSRPATIPPDRADRRDDHRHRGQRDPDWHDRRDTIDALGGDDTVFGGAGADLIQGGDGNDFLLGETDGDTVGGGNDDDYLWGGDGDDQLSGDAAATSLFGESGNDQLSGGVDRTPRRRRGDDTLAGGDGDDFLEGGPGDDGLTGGAGATSSSSAPGDGRRRDQRLQPRQRQDLRLGGRLRRRARFGEPVSLVSGAPGRSGASGQFLFDTDDGSLLWDADGTGSDPGVLIATLSNLPALTASDIVVV
jgi:Ca2+-binding RTX toxin-like protein